ncbi:protein CIMAP1D-like [Rhodnius prolixus]
MGKVDNCGPDLPGPGQYTLPPLIGCKAQDVTIWRSPCYSFGRKLKEVSSKSAGPGPSEYTVTNVTRFGKITTPCAKLNSRKISKVLQPLPGPDAYCPELHMNATLTRAPAFPFGRKYSYKPPVGTPAPNAYTIPDGRRMKGCLILGKRSEPKGAETPGPAAYGTPKIDLTRKRVFSATIGSRKEPKPPVALPGPGAYSPSYNYVLPRVPGFTINGKPNPCIKPYVGPNDNNF